MLYTVVDKDGKKFQFNVYRMVKTTNPEFRDLIGELCYGGQTNDGSMVMRSITNKNHGVKTSKIIEIEDNGTTRTVRTRNSVYVLERV